MQRRTYYFIGHVQGVGFRYTAKTAAAGYRVSGFVRNLDDGRVELVMEGENEEMDGVVETIHAELGENIKRSTCDAGEATGEFNGFEIRRSSQ